MSWSSFFGSGLPSDLSAWGNSQPEPASFKAPGIQRPEYSAVELWLVERIYQYIAEASVCSTCGARLNRKLRAPIDSLESQMKSLIVSTRCAGWRRHLHRAVVTAAPGDLILGHFERY
ncbi:MAG TPA: hypothetical protein VEJ87_10145 [Acidimicrobiales bacterium]|nr:hypothetical protein [Acidimicrobiales bacterium]